MRKRTDGSSEVSMWPKLTVVTPSLNQAQFLEEAISSVLDQNYPNLEYVIMDGGSTDGSIEIIRKYEKHLTYWTSSPDKGQADAITRGFAQGSGEWLAWLNADDFYLPGAFKAFQEAFEQDQGEVSLYFGTGEVLDQEKGVRRKFWPHSPSFSVEALIYGVDYIMQPTTFFKKTAFEAVGGLCQHFHYVMDYDLWIRIGRQFKVEAIKHPIACSREHPASKTATGRFGRWLEIQKMIISYAGTELTPGLLDYLLHDVYAATKETSSLIASAVRRCLLLTLRENAVVAKAFCSAGDWFPDQSVASQEPVETKMRGAARSHKSFFDQFNDLQRDLNRAKADALARLQNAERLERLLKESEADRAARLAEIERLGKQLAESEADRAARLAEMERVGKQLAESEADRAARLEVIHRLETQLSVLESRVRELEAVRNHVMVRLLIKLQLIREPKI